MQGMWLPTKRLADKSAALEAIRKLDEYGELDCHLKPIIKDDDSGDEDEELVEEKKKPHAGTERSINYFLNKV